MVQPGSGRSILIVYASIYAHGPARSADSHVGPTLLRTGGKRLPLLKADHQHRRKPGWIAQFCSANGCFSFEPLAVGFFSV